MAMGWRRYSDTEDLDKVYASIITGKNDGGLPILGQHIHNWRKRRKASLRTQELQANRDRVQRAAYERSLMSLGGEPAVRLPKSSVLAQPPLRRQDQGVTRTKSAGAVLDTLLAGAKEWVHGHSRILIKTAVGITVFFLVIVLPYQMIRSRPKLDQATPGTLAPQKVFTPRDLPEGFSVGSSTKTLENGALLYDIYGPDGEFITVSQQTGQADFDQSILNGAFKFSTVYGTAYIFDAPERITGYLFADETWVLFNTTDDLPLNDLRKLMETFRP